jgi:hypothetical protein
MSIQTSSQAARAAVALVSLLALTATGCMKRNFNDSRLRDAGENDGRKKTEVSLLAETGQEWVWMPQRQALFNNCPLYPNDLPESARGLKATGQYHLRKTGEPWAFNSDLWGVFCIYSEIGVGIFYTGQAKGNEDDAKSKIILTVSINPEDFGKRIPQKYHVEPRSGGCKLNNDGSYFSFYGNLDERDVQGANITDILTKPYAMLKASMCRGTTDANQQNQDVKKIIYWSWPFHRSLNPAWLFKEQIIFARKAIGWRWELGRNDFRIENVDPTSPNQKSQPVADDAADGNEGAHERSDSGVQNEPENVHLQDGSENRKGRSKAEKEDKKPRAKAEALRVAGDTSAFMWSNPIFRSWVIRDLRTVTSEFEIPSLPQILVVPMIGETARWSRKAGAPAPASDGQTGETQPPAQSNPTVKTTPPPAPSDRQDNKPKKRCPPNSLLTDDCIP